jgi:hypothetical protein
MLQLFGGANFPGASLLHPQSHNKKMVLIAILNALQKGVFGVLRISFVSYKPQIILDPA